MRACSLVARPPAQALYSVIAIPSSESPPPTSTQSPSGDWSDMTAARVRTTNVEGGGDAEETPRSRWFWFWSSDVVRLEVDLDIQSRRSRAPS